MSGGRLQLRLLISALLVCLAASPCFAGQMHHRVKKTETIPAPVTPVIPLTPAQMPATPATVVFKAGQLTVTAPNSTLGDILREVRKQTGASIDIPGNATERVMGVFGPGPARDVLGAILNGSHFNYILLGSATNPTTLERVMLFVKTAPEPANQQTTAQAQTPPPAAPPGGAQAEGGLNFGNDDSADSQQEGADIFGSADDQSNQAQDEQQGQPNPFGGTGNGVKTPQQLLQELQQQQQAQQQGQDGQQQNPDGAFPAGPRFRPGTVPGMPPQPTQSDPQQQQ
jgi:hypothetical protein